MSTLIGICIIQFSKAMVKEGNKLKNNSLTSSADWTDLNTSGPVITRHGKDAIDAIDIHKALENYETENKASVDEPEERAEGEEEGTTVQDSLLGVTQPQQKSFINKITGSAWYQSKPIRYSVLAGTGTVTAFGLAACYYLYKK